jgi:hypothetical protein
MDDRYASNAGAIGGVGAKIMPMMNAGRLSA